MAEIRSSVAPRDIDRFDDLVLKKEIEVMKVCVTIIPFYLFSMYFCQNEKVLIKPLRCHGGSLYLK